MSDRNLELLFEYLRSILFDASIQALPVESLDEPYRKLGEGLAFLQSAVEEMRTYTTDLSTGNLSGTQPARENLLCANLKNLHANLNHLTWQAKQVAAGDYSQSVSYLGEFSEAFNTMITQLREREALLKEEAAQEKRRAEIAQGYNELLTELTKKREEWILVVDVNQKEILYCNKQGHLDKLDSEICNVCKYRLPFREQILNWEDDGKHQVWEVEDGERMSARITSFPLEWQGHRACAHIVDDVTDQIRTTRELTNKAYHDSMTGLYNRSFFEEHMERVMKEKRRVLIGYMDLDGLKSVNDRYGHAEGDRYIRKFVDVIQKHFRASDVFVRMGGDEFCIILEKIQKEHAVSKMQLAMKDFLELSDDRYLCGFSFGIVGVEADEKNEMPYLRELIQKADAAMYECKHLKLQQREQRENKL